ncbi:futalosine hydrolase [Segetibacter sp. 3557_3]|uniref:futalosine hydrolase n=1 Tax=Segetibacter sp. 3557_3 TaxID=2547429 RepID=UPI001058F101|nr:futalosine hydrolase [Segetibacter sp. 3557_3]TDH18277.1 futalosine hydrolase [Segetibacter sp. 3557_3]
MRIFVTAATAMELNTISQHFKNALVNDVADTTCFQATGIGMLASCFSLTKLIIEQSPDLVIQVGIAGAFKPETPIGSVVVVEQDCPGDIGVYENGSFNDLFQMGLDSGDTFPFTGRILRNPWLPKLELRGLSKVNGVTINEISTSPERINYLSARYNPAVESMEGAALHYTCLQTNTPFLQFRSVSNLVGERNKKHWNIPLALRNLAEQVILFLEQLDQTNLKTLS